MYLQQHIGLLVLSFPGGVRSPPDVLDHDRLHVQFQCVHKPFVGLRKRNDRGVLLTGSERLLLRIGDRGDVQWDHPCLSQRRLRYLHSGDETVLRQRRPDMQLDRLMGNRGGVHGD